MNVPLTDSITNNLRLKQMHTGVLGSYAMHDGDWEERYRIEAAHAVPGETPLRPRRHQQEIFEARRAAFAARHKRPAPTQPLVAV